jgi:hypothetical protein
MYPGSNMVGRQVTTIRDGSRVTGIIRLVSCRPEAEDPTRAFVFLLELDDGKMWSCWSHHCTTVTSTGAALTGSTECASQPPFGQYPVPSQNENGKK